MLTYLDGFQGKKILITGGLGFIGSNLAHRLVELGADVLIVDSLIPGYGGNLFNIADIKDQMVPLLLKIGSVLAETEGDIIIAGHTDNVPLNGGPYGSNLKLSIARAATVAEFLLAQAAIAPSRLSTMGFGKYRPMESNDNSEGRKRNRRVEIVLRAPEAEPSRTPRPAGPKIIENKTFFRISD